MRSFQIGEEIRCGFDSQKGNRADRRLLLSRPASD